MTLRRDRIRLAIFGGVITTVGIGLGFLLLR